MMTACSVDDVISTEKDDSEKTPIEFSMTDNTGATVAVSGNTRAGFSSNTKLVVKMVAEKTETNNSTTTTSYKYTETSATAKSESGNTGYSDVNFGNDVRYWDDAFGRDTKLSIYAVAVPGQTDNSSSLCSTSSNSNTSTWTTVTSAPVNKLTWTVNSGENAQTSENINKHDLVYSCNIQSNAPTANNVNGVYRWTWGTTNNYPTDFNGSNASDKLIAGQMQFTLKDMDVADGPGKFDKGNMHFVHALSRLTVKVNKTEGHFAENEKVSGVSMLNMPVSGSFDVTTGSFTVDTNNGYANVSAATITDENKNTQYMAQVLPGYKFKDNSATNAISFKVGQNVYYVTQDMIYEALKEQQGVDKSSETASDVVMTQGKNYVLTVTVSKTAVKDLTATLAGWTTVEGSAERNNAYLTYNFSSYTGTNSSNFTLYRSAVTYDNPVTNVDNTSYAKNYSWASGYKNNSTTPSYSDNKWTLSPDWYWNDNKTFYHFRMVGNSGDAGKSATISTDGTGIDAKEYFEIKNASTTGNYTWGAPIKIGTNSNNVTLYYNTSKGFDATSADDKENTNHNISEAIGATESQIKLTEVNMLSHVTVKLQTTKGKDKVTLTDGNNKTKVELVGVYAAGKVYMGNGLAVTTGSRSTTGQQMTEVSGKDNTYDYYVVPQALTETNGDNTTYVYFKITTPDNNVYYVKEKLSQITVSNEISKNVVTTSQTKDKTIDYWYPGCSYTYTFTLSKTGVNMTATLVPYTEISGSSNVTIED